MLHHYLMNNNEEKSDCVTFLLVVFQVLLYLKRRPSLFILQTIKQRVWVQSVLEIRSRYWMGLDF